MAAETTEAEESFPNPFVVGGGALLILLTLLFITTRFDRDPLISRMRLGVMGGRSTRSTTATWSSRAKIAPASMRSCSRAAVAEERPTM